MGLCGKSSFHLVGTVGALYNIILKLTNIILFLSQVLAYSGGSVAHLKKRLFMGLYIGNTTPFVCQMSLGGTFGSANIHSPRYVRSCYGSITTTIHHPYLKIHRLGSAEAISYLFEGQQNGTRPKYTFYRQNVCLYVRF